MDRAWIGSMNIAINKAFTARMFDLATKGLAEKAQPGAPFFGIHETNGGRVIIFVGGVPLRRGNEIVAPWVSVTALGSRTRHGRLRGSQSGCASKGDNPRGEPPEVAQCRRQSGEPPGNSVSAAWRGRRRHLARHARSTRCLASHCRERRSAAPATT